LKTIDGAFMQRPYLRYINPLTLSLSLLLLPNQVGAEPIVVVEDLLLKTRTRAKDLLAQGEISPQVLLTQLTDELDKVTITASLRLQKVRETPSSIYVIDQKKMQQRRARTAGDAIQGIPGLVSNLAEPLNENLRFKVGLQVSF
jgi:outer membrane receptor for ferric coprogen and ferric-rhodotorulic acid